MPSVYVVGCRESNTSASGAAASSIHHEVNGKNSNGANAKSANPRRAGSMDGNAAMSDSSRRKSVEVARTKRPPRLRAAG